MKKLTVLILLCLSQVAFSQTDIDQILEIGVENAQKFSEDYFAPAGEALINNMSNGWYTTAKTKKLWHFEVGFVGNLSFVREDKQSFILNVVEYNNLTFSNGQFSQSVASTLGNNTDNISVIINEGQASELEVVLPDGIGSSVIKSLPSGFIQASMGLIKSTEVKIRVLPRIKAVEDAEIQLYGIAFQHEVTDWVYSLRRWPVKLAALIGYTNVKGFYDLNANTGVVGTDQEVRLNSNSWLLTTIVSTKMPVFNFYGGLGYYFGANNADLLGTYQIQNGPFTSDEITDPISVKTKTKGVKATLGARATFGVFKANLDYTLQNFNNLSLGLSFGW
ncbi:hypothetical protein D1816_10440 [Aquimarina sp. AD10]|uniref:DUF6588 family protein n=1 Tax=Aquimarina TaxID=290174 RepID=UPI000E4EA1AE|nr:MULTISPECIES: DUF6588 family protein [Aquimarina]AXT60748.1 hypothetical protein D1816_10440 [Aquimarina sp. AD10]RKM95774.1 hypothetical protein D7033_16460 [Aquimarina sp. AD10]